MKKKKITKKELNILNDINDLLLYEEEINKKIANNEELSYKEYFFIKYCISPRKVINTILSEGKK